LAHYQIHLFGLAICLGATSGAYLEGWPRGVGGGGLTQ